MLNVTPELTFAPLSPQSVGFSHGYLLNSLNRLPTAFIFFPPCPTVTRIFHTGKNYFMNEKN